MTRILEAAAPNGGVRVLILGAGTYPNAQVALPRAPQLPDIASASLSAVTLALRLLGPWRQRFALPLASVDLLANAPGSPGGLNLGAWGGPAIQIDPPTLGKIKMAKSAWLGSAGPADMLLFYCCGHGIWLPELTGRTFLASDFPDDPENPWPSAVALDDFRLALSERAPRKQWLIYDCCANTPTAAIEALAPKADSLIVGAKGGRALAKAQYGDLQQVIMATSSLGEQAFGKVGRASRFMEAFVEACDGSAFFAQDGDGWWADRQSIESAISTYASRVAPPEERDYFTFPQLSETDSTKVPRLLRSEAASDCIFLARSDPAYRLSEASLTLTRPPSAAILHAQAAGGDAIFRRPVPAFEVYALRAQFPDADLTQTRRAIPPVAEVVF